MAKLIRDHLYDAGFPRNDGRGCIADLPCLCDDPDHDGHHDSGVCGEPLNKHALSQYGVGMEEGEQMNHADAGSMHEPKPYTGKLDWPDHESRGDWPLYD